MYLLNGLSLSSLQARFIQISRFRTAQNLSGVKDGTNLVFHTPGTDKFAHNLPFLDVTVYYNGVRLTLLDDYMVSESGGPGTGFDTITVTMAPYPDDHLVADYVLA